MNIEIILKKQLNKFYEIGNRCEFSNFFFLKLYIFYILKVKINCHCCLINNRRQYRSRIKDIQGTIDLRKFIVSILCSQADTKSNIGNLFLRLFVFSITLAFSKADLNLSNCTFNSFLNNFIS